MNALTCHDVEPQLDLLAAGECDRPTRRAIERHLEQCPVCAASFAESQRVLGLLDLHWNAGGLERLQERIAQEARPILRPRLFSPVVRPILALAALLLVTLGLSLQFRGSEPDESQPELQVAVLQSRADALDPQAVRAMRAPAPAMIESMALESKSSAMLPLILRLTNTGQRVIEVQLGDARTELTLDVQGPGVVRRPAVGIAEPEVLRPRTIRLAAGEEHVFRIDQLLAGSRGRVQRVYLTEPGDYTLTARLRVMVSGRMVTLTSEAMRIKVVEPQRP